MASPTGTHSVPDCSNHATATTHASLSSNTILPPASMGRSTIVMSGLTASNVETLDPREMDSRLILTTTSDPSFYNPERGTLALLVRASDRTRLMRDTMGRATRVRASSSPAATSGVASPRASNTSSIHESMCASQSGEGSAERPTGIDASLASQEAESGDLSSWGCVGAVVNLILGNAIFTIPYGFLLSGWLSIPVVVFTTGLLCYTAGLLGSALTAVKARGAEEPDYGLVGELAFGAKFRVFFTMLCAGECFFMCVFFLVFIAETIAAPLKLPKDVLIAAAGLLGVLMSLVPKRFVSLVSIVGLGLTLSCVAAVAACGLHIHPWNTNQSMYGTKGVDGAIYTASFVAICVADHPIFPGLYNSVRKPSDYFNGLRFGFLSFASIALVLAGISYLTFGSNLQPVVLSNMGRDNQYRLVPRMGWIGTTANILIVFRTLLVLPSFIRPVVGLVQDIFFMTIRKYTDQDVETYVATRRGLRLLLLTVSFGLCALAAIALAEFLPSIEALTSSLFKSINAVIIPVWSHDRLCRAQGAGRPSQRFNSFVMVLGAIAWAVYGTYIAAEKILAKSIE